MKSMLRVKCAVLGMLFLFLGLQLSAQISVTATVGTPGPTPYVTLNAAFAAINAGTHRGVINVSVTGNTTEPGMCTLNASGTGAANYTYVLIKPAPATNPVISGSVNNNPLIKILGNFVSINGSNSSAATRNLSITNNGVNNSNIIAFTSTGATFINNDTVQNAILTNGDNTSEGVIASDATIGNAGRFTNIAIINNSIRNAETAVYLRTTNAAGNGNGVVVSANDMNGTGANRIRNVGVYMLGLDNTGGGIFNNNIANFIPSNEQKIAIWLDNNTRNTTVSGNTISSISTSFTSGGLNIGVGGIFVDVNRAAANINLSGNTITGLLESGREVATGISVFGTVGNVNIIGNTVGDVENTNTNGNAANGILLSSTSNPANINVYNNFVYRIVSYGSNSTLGALQNGFGIVVRSGAGYQVYHNTVNMTGGQSVGISAAFFVNNSANGGIDLRDNIFVNNQTTVGTDRYAILNNDNRNRFAIIDYNACYSVDRVGYQQGTTFNTLALMQTFFGGNTNSIILNPTFVSATDLHLQFVPANNPLNGGTFITAPSITTDIDGNPRTNPTMGADELAPCSVPGAITGITTLCPGTTTQLSNSVAGGTWSSGTPTVATVITGPSAATTVTGVDLAGGTTVITYSTGTLPACSVTTNITITAAPAVSGSLSVCSGSSTQLSSTVAGTWTSATPSVATVTTGGGLVSGVVPGTSVITFTAAATGCTRTVTMTVISTPAAITGSTSVCIGSTISLSSTTGGGTWVSGTPAVATVTLGPGSGIVGGVSAGTSAITYTAGLGCSVTTSVIVNALPPANTGTVTVCAGSSTILTNATPGGGTWSSSNVGLATVTAGPATTGTVWGVAAGTPNITFTAASTGCIAVTPVTVLALPGIISGLPTVCVGATIPLSNAVAGGTWTSGTLSVATIVASTGVVTGVLQGNSVITYSNGCASPTFTVTVLAAPGAITGVSSVCAGSQITLSNAAAAGTWTSSVPASATVTAGPVGGGVVSGVAPVSSVISYSNGCGSAALYTVTVTTAPNAITGNTTVCFGLTTTLSNNGFPTGTWTSSNATAATINATTGVVTSSGSAAGGTTIITAANLCGSTTTNVTAAPAPFISGNTTMCQNATTTLSSSLGNGVWASSNPAVATTTSVGPVGVISGTGLGLAPGTVLVTHTTGAGCVASVSVTTTPSPTAIIGIFNVCAGSITNLTDQTPGGIWTSTTTSVATVSASPGGDVHGVAAGNTVISYTIGICAATATVSVDPVPGPISGPSSVCVGSVISLGNSVSPIFWSSSNNAVATVDAAGDVTGVAPGSVTITASTPFGCKVTKLITVNVAPGPIGGNLIICAGQTTQLSDPVAGGTWSSGSPAVATVTINGGLVTGVAAGQAAITHSLLSGCFVTATVTVNPLPGPIVGPTNVCTGTTPTFVNGTGGGTWSSSNSSVLTVDAGNGNAGGIVPGNAVVTYLLPTGCINTLAVTVSQTPAAITGIRNVCVGSTTNLSDITPSGVWSSVTPGVATIGSLNGVVSGVAAGISEVSYTLAGCSATTTVTVNPLPSPIVGPSLVCQGLTIALTDLTVGGTWASSNPSIATVGATDGIVTGNNPGIAVISYILSTGCSRTINITVNPLPAAITGTTSVCQGLTTNLSTATLGGTWTSSTPSIATIGSSTGVVTGISAGNSNITYTLGTGCLAMTTVTVNPLPGPIVGITTIMCAGGSIGLTDASLGGTWSSSNNTVATVTPGPVGGGIVFGGATPGGTARITYILPTGCLTTISVTVNPLPTDISGIPVVCAGSTTQLSNGVTGGIWSSSNNAVASVVPGPLGVGIVRGGNVSLTSTAVITYTLGTGCTKTITVTVNPLPDPIAGNTIICAGQTTQLSDGTPNGTWSSSNNTIASVAASGGLVTGGVTPGGTARITYTLVSTGCIITTSVIVNPLPGAISGPDVVCEGATINLSTSSTTGVWSSANVTVASVAPAGGFGVVTGGSTGGSPSALDTIIYTLPSGCIQTKTITVNIQPAPITGGPLSICQQAFGYLSDATPGGVWSSSNVPVASVNNFGVVQGGNVGSATITYNIAGCRSLTTAFVNTQPVAITGATALCFGTSVRLSNATPGGGWSSDNLSVATINGAGVITTGLPGMTTGTANITYTIGSCTAMTTVTVNVQPTAITGNNIICNLSATTLSEAVTGGVWSSSNTNASVDASGVVTGTMPYIATAVAGSSVISYTMPTGCFVIRNVTIKVQPLPISGIKTVCLGSSTQLSSAPGGGVWSVSTTALATITVSGTGLVTGVAAGTVLTEPDYTINGCSVTTTITVNPLPSQMTGAFYVCQGSSTTLANLTPLGTWSSSNPAIATINTNTGVVSGITTGTTNITYQLPTGCITTHTLTVIPSPAPISGSTTVCQGLSAQLSDFTNGGTWTSSNSSIADIDPVTGVATGINSGTVIISYTLGTGCRVVSPLAVHPRTPITGATSALCIGQATNLSNATVGGTWSSSNPAVATVNIFTGIVTGLTTGTAVISTNWSTGCAATLSVTVLPQPAPITGPGSVCVGQTISLSNVTPGGIWSSNNISIADVSPSGDVIGIAAGNVIISYTQGCAQTATISVLPLPDPIIGSAGICVGTTQAYTDATPGGIWSSSNTAAATIDPVTGIATGVAAGFTTILYTLPSACAQSLAVNVNPLPGTITGSPIVCVGSTTQLSNAVPGGLWTSSNPGVANVHFTSGVVTGVAAGTAVITYQVATGCIQTFTMTVNPLPTISGTSQVCTGSSITLAAAGGPGSWSSSNPAVASVDPVTGVVTGITSGTTTIIYTLSTGCSAAIIVTVNPAPAPITGINLVCTGQTTQLFNTTLFGTWSSSNTYVGTIDVNTGVTGSSSPATSTYIVTYTLPTGCYTTTTVTVTTPPGPITGPGDVCMLDSIQLANSIPGGIWTSQYPANATVSATGEVFGVTAGFTIVTYTMGGGSCYVSQVIVVNPIPAPITGTTQVCHGLTTQLFDATPNGVWTSGNNAIAIVDPNTGVVTGTNLTGSPLPVDIFYTLPTGCYVKTTVTVNPLPLPITGNTNICVGGTRTLSDSPTPGTWSSANTNIATVDPVTGVVTGVNYSVGPPPGTTVAMTNITYTIIATGCIRTTTVAVHPLPQVFLVTGGGSYCAGTAAPHVYLSGSEIGVQYYLYLGATPTGTFAGTGGPLDMGPQIPAGNYTVVAVNNFTTCGITMTGHASVTILPLTPPSVTINASPSGPICAGTTVNFTASTINGGTSPAYMWSVNGVNVSTASAYSFVPANGDEVTVTFTSTAQCGLPRDAHDTVVMSVTPAALPALNLTVSPNDTVCTSVQVTLSVIGTNVGTAPAYLWYVNNTMVASGPATTYTYTPSDGDIVYARMSSNAQCRLADTVRSNAETISVKDPVIPGVLITSDPGTLLAVGQTATLTAHVTNAVNPTYQWYINGSPVPGATDSVLVRNNFNYPRPDSISCVVINTSYCGEQGFSWIYIVLHPVGVTTVTAASSDINVIPNPNKGVFTVKGTLGSLADEDVSLELTNMLGQVVYHDNVTAKNGKLDQRIELSSTLANGMYMLSVRTGGEHKVFHLVVEQ